MKLLLIFAVAVTTAVTAEPIRLRAQHAAVIQEDMAAGRKTEVRKTGRKTEGRKTAVERYADMMELYNTYGDNTVTYLKLFWKKSMGITKIPFTEAQIAEANPDNAAEMGIENHIYHAFLVLGLTNGNHATQFIKLERIHSLGYKKINKKKWKPKGDTKEMVAVPKIPKPITLKKMFEKLESYALKNTFLRGGSGQDRLKQYADEYHPETMNCQHFTWDVLRALFRDVNGDGSVISIPVGNNYWKKFSAPDLSQDTEVLFNTLRSKVGHLARVPNIVPRIQNALGDAVSAVGDAFSSIW